MGETGQTPGSYLRGGGAGFFSADCVAALAECGLSPDDFGTYDQVKDKLRAAKRRVMEHKLARARGQPNAVPAPSAHDRLLAQSEAGHLRQNALFQRERGNSCQNEQPRPGYPGAQGYHHDLAPCGPHPSGTGSNKTGTTHWAQGEHEAGVRQGRNPGDPVGGPEIRQRSQETSRLTAHGPTDQQLQGQNGWAKRRRNQEADARQASADELKRANAGKVQGAGNVPGGVADGKTAEDCIQAYTDLGMQAMRQQVMNDYSEENYGATKARLAQAEADAGRAKTAAEQNFQDALARARAAPPGPGRWDDVQRAGMARTQARQDFAQAQAANASAHCLRDQVRQMQQNGVPADMSGSVPGWGRGQASRPQYKGQSSGTEQDE